MKKANERRELSNDHQGRNAKWAREWLKQIDAHINDAALNGRFEVTIYQSVPDEIIRYLEEDGYDIEKTSNKAGVLTLYRTHISWE